MFMFSVFKIPVSSLRKSIVNCQLSHILRASHGMGALPTVLLIGMIVAEIAVAGAAVAFLSISSNQARVNSEIALVTAKAAIQDALIMLAINKDYALSPGASTTDGAQTRCIVVEKDIPAVGQTRVRATGTYKKYTARLEAIVDIDATTGQTELLSLSQVTTAFSCP